MIQRIDVHEYRWGGIGRRVVRMLRNAYIGDRAQAARAFSHIGSENRCHGCAPEHQRRFTVQLFSENM